MGPVGYTEGMMQDTLEVRQQLLLATTEWALELHFLEERYYYER